MGSGEGWKAQRRSSQSSWDNRPCTDGTIKEQYPQKNGSTFWEPGATHFGQRPWLGREGSHAGRVSGVPTPALAWPPTSCW